MLETLGTVCVLSLGCFKSTYFISRTFSGHIVWRSAYRNVLNIFLCAIYKQESNHMRDYELFSFFFFFFFKDASHVSTEPLKGHGDGKKYEIGGIRI